MKIPYDSRKSAIWIPAQNPMEDPARILCPDATTAYNMCALLEAMDIDCEPDFGIYPADFTLAEWLREVELWEYVDTNPRYAGTDAE